MKRIVFGIAFLLSFSVLGQITKSVLFLGNSYTGVNNLPQMVADLATSTSDVLQFQSNTPGGYTFNGHSTNAISLSMIQNGGWDFVVLQEQSQLPSFPISQVQTDCFPYATLLDSLILAYIPCAETMFYMTWGRENGDNLNCPSWPPVCTYEGMDSLLRLRYEQMAVDNQAVLSPVGALWRYLRIHHPSIGLYAGDGSHPSLAGSYAAACSFYTAIFRKDPTLITTDLGVSMADALIIRNAAKAVVYDSLLAWHVGEYDPIADFSMNNLLNTNTVQFTNLSANATTFAWDFGNGNTSTDVNPMYTFPTAGMYLVTLIASHCGWTDTLVQEIILTTSGLSEEVIFPLEMTPNPVVDFLTVPFEVADEISIVDASGKKVDIAFERKGDLYVFDFSAYPSGLYIITLTKSETKYVGRVLK